MSVQVLQPGEWYELDGSREVTYEPDGPTGTRLFRCRWDEKKGMMLALCPIGAPFLVDEPNLICRRVTVKGDTPLGREDGVGYSLFANTGIEYVEARITAVYGPPSEGGSGGTEPTYKQSWDFSSEVLDLGVGRKWKGLQVGPVGSEVDLTVEVPQSILNPLREYTFEVTYPDKAILDSIEGLVGKLNDTAWGGKSEQTLLYMGARVTEVWDEQGVQGFRAAHRILGRQRSWNLFWREPRQKRYPEGNRRAGQLMWDGNGQPLMVAGAAGVPGWTEMDPAVYELGNFDTLLNI